MTADPKIIVALDFADPAEAMALSDRLDPNNCALKVGKELFVAGGPEPVRRMIGRGFRVFLDLKFHDIPNTVARACAAAARLGVWMLDVHAAGGRSMLVAARDAVARAAAESGGPKPLLIAVTVLTSLDASDLREVGFASSPESLALNLARLAQDCGLEGVVCSAVEAPALRRALGAGAKLVTPGIRLASESADDQARIATPAAAIANGADYLVIGRSITQAADPRAALERINVALRESSG
ncbi:MAG TPA: orotidine-5'-phosphate decarboxylase [Casimicrobiaceae bacterium]|nr:orotidine-5'-phosphate decarboxylase [Casimicrobiaceae bacterium]